MSNLIHLTPYTLFPTSLSQRNIQLLRETSNVLVLLDRILKEYPDLVIEGNTAYVYRNNQWVDLRDTRIFESYEKSDGFWSNPVVKSVANVAYGTFNKITGSYGSEKFEDTLVGTSLIDLENAIKSSLSKGFDITWNMMTSSISGLSDFVKNNDFAIDLGIDAVSGLISLFPGPGQLISAGIDFLHALMEFYRATKAENVFDKVAHTLSGMITLGFAAIPMPGKNIESMILKQGLRESVKIASKEAAKSGIRMSERTIFMVIFEGIFKAIEKIPFAGKVLTWIIDNLSKGLGWIIQKMVQGFTGLVSKILSMLRLDKVVGYVMGAIGKIEDLVKTTCIWLSMVIANRGTAISRELAVEALKQTAERVAIETNKKIIDEIIKDKSKDVILKMIKDNKTSLEKLNDISIKAIDKYINKITKKGEEVSEQVINEIIALKDNPFGLSKFMKGIVEFHEAAKSGKLLNKTYWSAIDGSAKFIKTLGKDTFRALDTFQAEEKKILYQLKTRINNELGIDFKINSKNSKGIVGVNLEELYSIMKENKSKFRDIDISRIINATHINKDGTIKLMDDGLAAIYGVISARDIKSIDELWEVATGKKFGGKFLAEVNWKKLAAYGSGTAALTGGVPVGVFVPLLRLHKTAFYDVAKIIFSPKRENFLKEVKFSAISALAQSNWLKCVNVNGQLLKVNMKQLAAKNLSYRLFKFIDKIDTEANHFKSMSIKIFAALAFSAVPSIERNLNNNSNLIVLPDNVADFYESKNGISFIGKLASDERVAAAKKYFTDFRAIYQDTLDLAIKGDLAAQDSYGIPKNKEKFEFKENQDNGEEFRNIIKLVQYVINKDYKDKKILNKIKIDGLVGPETLTGLYSHLQYKKTKTDNQEELKNLSSAIEDLKKLTDLFRKYGNVNNSSFVKNASKSDDELDASEVKFDSNDTDGQN